PTPAASVGRCPPLRSATANAPAPKTASAASKTLVCAICPSTAITPTGSGSRSSPWPLTSSPGHRPWPSTHITRPASGSQNASAFAYSPWPAASSAPAAGDDSGYPETGPGTTSLTPAGPACALPEQPTHPPTKDRRTGDHSAGNHPCPYNDDAQHHRRP